MSVITAFNLASLLLSEPIPMPFLLMALAAMFPSC